MFKEIRTECVDDGFAVKIINHRNEILGNIFMELLKCTSIEEQKKEMDYLVNDKDNIVSIEKYYFRKELILKRRTTFLKKTIKTDYKIPMKLLTPQLELYIKEAGKCSY